MADCRIAALFWANWWTMRPGAFSLLSLICVVSLCGCDNSESAPLLTKVYGTVTYLDRPLTGGAIVFIPDEERGTMGAIVHAEIQPNGNYYLRSGERDGIPPGSYRVTVRPADVAPGRGRSHWPQLLDRYSDPHTSGLSCKVQNVEAHTINFHLQ
jgi:hypothetical protein